MRSGTTVIHRALCTAENANPHVSESWLLRDVMQMYWNRLQRFDTMGADQFGSVENFRELIALNVHFYLRTISALYGNPDLLILKHPELSPYFPEMAGMFPAMHFLVIVRDPRDVIASMLTVSRRHAEAGTRGPFSRFDLAGLCRYYAAHYAPALAAEQAGESRIRFLRYEDAMRAPETFIVRTGEASGGRYPADVRSYRPERIGSATFDRDRRQQDPHGAAFWSELYLQDINTNRIGAFGSVLSDAQIRHIEQALAPIGCRFDYW